MGVCQYEMSDVQRHPAKRMIPRVHIVGPHVSGTATQLPTSDKRASLSSHVTVRATGQDPKKHLQTENQTC